LLLSILWRLSPNYSNTVEDPMNMSIDRNRWCLEPVDKDTVSSLTPDRGELKQLIHILRNLASILVEQDPGDLLDSPCFRIVEAHWLDESCDSPGICSGQALDVGEPGEEPGGSESCNRVLGSMRQHGRDQDSERITVSRIANLMQRRGIILPSPIDRSGGIFDDSMNRPSRLHVKWNFHFASFRTVSKLPLSSRLSSSGVSNIQGSSRMAS